MIGRNDIKKSILHAEDIMRTPHKFLYKFDEVLKMYEGWLAHHMHHKNYCSRMVLQRERLPDAFVQIDTSHASM